MPFCQRGRREEKYVETVTKLFYRLTTAGLSVRKLIEEFVAFDRQGHNRQLTKKLCVCFN